MAILGSTSVLGGLGSTGGREIAYAENTTASITVPTGSFTAIPSLSLAIPAGTGPYMVEFNGLFNATATGAGAAQVWVQIIDDGGLKLITGSLRWQLAASGQVGNAMCPLKKRMPATSTAKTISVQHFVQVVNAGATLLAGDGLHSGTFDLGPTYLQAYTR